jgi:hypothetical protein
VPDLSKIGYRASLNRAAHPSKSRLVVLSPAWLPFHARAEVIEMSSSDTAGRLFDLQLKFNLFPAMYAHQSWIEHLGLKANLGMAQMKSATSTFWLRRLSDALLRARELDRQFDFDFFDRAKRVALLDDQALARVGGLVAAVLVREHLRGAVRGPEVEALQHAIGSAARRFALRSNLDLPPVPAQLCRLGRHSPTPVTWARRVAVLVTAIIPVTSPGTLGRLQFKFPQSWARLKRLQLTEKERVGLTELFVAVISQESKEWAWLF